MKPGKQLLSLIASAAALVLSIPLPAAQAATVPVSEIAIAESHSAEARCSTTAEAIVALREKLRERETEFSIPVVYNVASSKDKVDALLYSAVEETSSPKEGDYIRYSFDAYGYSADADWLTRTVYINFTVMYNTTAEQEKELDLKVRDILDKLNVYNAPDLVKIRAVYDYVVRSTTYSRDLSSKLIFSAYGAAINGDAVCQGYAQLVYRLLRELGISCRIVPGSSDGTNHAWNMVEVDGTYYFLDATWESLLGADKYYYFLRGTEDLDSIAGLETHEFKAAPHESTPLNEEADSGRLLSRYNIAKRKYDAESYKTDTNYGATDNSGSKGDVNGDGAVDASDATMILQAYSALSIGAGHGLSAAQTAAADVDGDSAITSSDATYVLMYYNYLATTVRPVDINTFVSDQK